MKLAKDDLVAALRLRYDFYSAQTMFESARTRAGLPEQTAYDLAEITAFRAALATVGDRLTAVEARLDLLVEPDGMTSSLPPVTASSPVMETPASIAVAEPPAAAPVAKPRRAKSSADASARQEPATPASPLATPAREITIALTGVDLAADERVLVCGGLAELGDWEPTRALAMVRDGDRWLARLALVAGVEASFKFVRCDRDGSAIWEDGDDRRLVAGSDLDATWQ